MEGLPELLLQACKASQASKASKPLDRPVGSGAKRGAAGGVVANLGKAQTGADELGRALMKPSKAYTLVS
jgi:hypothetical protein